MIRPIKSLNKYKYVISDVILTLSNGEQAVIKTSEIRSLTSYKDYRNNIIPYMLLVCSVKKDLYESIITDINKMTATLSVQYSENLSDTQSGYNKPIISKTFKVVNQDLLDTRVVSHLKNMADKDNDVDIINNISQHTIDLNLFLFDHESIRKFKICKSYIINGTMNDVLYKMFKDRDFSDILMTSVSDKTVRDYMLPYGSFGENLSSLNENYGIYNAPYVFFIDDSVIYLIDPSNEGKTLQSGELGIVNMYLERTDDSSSIETGCYIDRDSGNYILNLEPFVIADSDSLIDFYGAGKVTTAISGEKNNYSDMIGDYDVERAFLGKHDKAHKQNCFSINELKRNIPCDFYDIDVSIITPNKKYSLWVDPSYKNYEDESFRLNQSTVCLYRQSDDEFRCAVHCNFSKILKE